MKNQFRILLVSDIHVGMKQVYAMIDRVVRSGKSIDLDMILCCGDIADLPSKSIGIAEQESASEADVSRVISALESLVTKVYYIPGNVRKLLLLRFPFSNQEGGGEMKKIQKSKNPKNKNERTNDASKTARSEFDF